MKKKNLKSLKLNKNSISTFTTSISGGLSECTSWEDHIGCNSANGCHTGPDATMTCWHWSCLCNK